MTLILRKLNMISFIIKINFLYLTVLSLVFLAVVFTFDKFSSTEILFSFSFSVKLLDEYDPNNEISIAGTYYPVNIEFEEKRDPISNYHDLIKIDNYLSEKYGVNIHSHPNKMDIIINILLDIDLIKYVALDQGYSVNEFKRLINEDVDMKNEFIALKEKYNQEERNINYGILRQHFKDYGLED